MHQNIFRQNLLPSPNDVHLRALLEYPRLLEVFALERRLKVQDVLLRFPAVVDDHHPDDQQKRRE